MGRLGRVRRLLPAKDWSTRTCTTLAFDDSARRPGRPAGAPPRFLYHPDDVRTDRAGLGPARDQRPAAGRALSLDRRICPGRIAPRGRRAGRRRPLHGAPDVQGHGRVPVDAGDQRGDRGCRRLVQRRDRPGIDGLLGPRATARVGSGDGCPRRADRSPDAWPAREIESERTVIVEEIRSYLDDPSEYCQILFQTALFGDGPLGREICGDEDGIRALPAKTIRDFWRSRIPAGQHRRGGRRRPRPRRESSTSSARLSGPGTGRCPVSHRRRPCPPGRRVATGKRDTARRSCASASRPCTAITRTAGRWPCSTPSSATG